MECNFPVQTNQIVIRKLTRKYILGSQNMNRNYFGWPFVLIFVANSILQLRWQCNEQSEQHSKRRRITRVWLAAYIFLRRKLYQRTFIYISYFPILFIYLIKTQISAPWLKPNTMNDNNTISIALRMCSLNVFRPRPL